MKRKAKARAIAVVRQRNPLALHPLLRKGHAHQKSGKALRKRAADRLRHDPEGDLQALTAVAA